jgi:hypothetical protein
MVYHLFVTAITPKRNKRGKKTLVDQKPDL